MLILLGIVVLFVLLNVLGKRNSTSVNATDRDNVAVDIINRIDAGQLKLAKAGKRFTSSIGTLTATDQQLATDLAIGVDLTLSAADDGKAYVSRVLTTQIVLVRNRTGTGAAGVRDSCLDANTKSGISCPTSATDISKQIEAQKKADAEKAKNSKK
jgi:hypothetical protein